MKLSNILTKIALAAAISCLLLFLPNTITAQSSEPPLKVTVTTSFLADMVQQITDGTVELTQLIPAGSDPHTYSPQARDLEAILEADLIIYHGLRFEAQIAEILEDYGHSVTQTFDPADLIKVSDNSAEVDPHYWFNLDLYQQSVSEAQVILTEAAPELTAVFAANTEAYLKELEALAVWTDEQLALLPIEERILVTPHDAFSYFAQQNGFVVYAPQGISTESEVSNEQIVRTVEFIVDHQVPAIFLDTTSNPQAMQKLQEGVQQQGAEVKMVSGENQELFSDSLAPQGQPYDTYIEMYRHNVSLIVEYLTR